MFRVFILISGIGKSIPSLSIWVQKIVQNRTIVADRLCFSSPNRGLLGTYRALPWPAKNRLATDVDFAEFLAPTIPFSLVCGAKSRGSQRLLNGIFTDCAALSHPITGIRPDSIKDLRLRSIRPEDLNLADGIKLAET